ncbi:MAG: NAD(P)H-hydrate dehydratase [Chitinophagales bacterium]
MKVFSSAQIRELDAATIAEENITSYALMERAAQQFTDWFLKMFSSIDEIIIFCGTGNNGGDGLCVARHLYKLNYKVRICIVGDVKKASDDFTLNFHRVWEIKVPVFFFDVHNFPQTQKKDIIIDAIFGSGLNRTPEGIYKDVIEKINASPAKRISIDVPSGFFCDEPTTSACIHANHTLSFEFPKLGFFFPENYQFTGDWETISIGLSKKKISTTGEIANYILPYDIKNLYKPRKKFDHKGTFGHSLLIAGNAGMEGASALSGKACLVTGSGLVTICSEKRQWFYPELMHVELPELSQSLQEKKIDAVAIGPGLGVNDKTTEIIKTVIQNFSMPIVFDADALNCIAKNKNLLDQLPKNSILTPHPKEFERLFGASENSFNQLALQKAMSMKYSCFIILKRAYTCITTPDANVFFNSTGNPGMATAGSGDVLTGMITGLLAQKYAPEHAAILGTYLHGFSGDLVMKKSGGQNLPASDIIENIQAAFKVILENKSS